MEKDATTFDHLVTLIHQTHEALLGRAAKAVNVSLTLRNWLIGFHIAEFELTGADRAAYGERLLADLAKAVRARRVSSMGRRQLYGYLAFYRAYPQIAQTLSSLSRLPGIAALQEKVRTLSAQSAEAPVVGPDRLVSQLSYSHLERIVELSDPLKRRFYEIEAIRGNWSVRELRRQIDTQYFERCGLSTDKEALSRLAHAQAESQSAAEVIRDPYVFEFLSLQPREVMSEGRREDALIDKLQDFLLELGHGFCFEARQKRLLMGDEHCFVNLVFYHRVLKCHVLVELKNDRFRHEHLGQLNPYVAWYKQHQMTPGDQPPIGIFLCTHRTTSSWSSRWRACRTSCSCRGIRFGCRRRGKLRSSCRKRGGVRKKVSAQGQTASGSSQ